MQEFIGPFNFENMSLEEARVSFSGDWKNLYSSQVIRIQPIQLVALDGSHISYSYEFSTASVGTTKNDSLVKLIITINGLYNNYLLTGNFPYFKAAEGGMINLKNHLHELGWIFSDDGSFIMTTVEEHIRRVPEFKINVLDKANSQIDLDLDLPVFT